MATTPYRPAPRVNRQSHYAVTVAPATSFPVLPAGRGIEPCKGLWTIPAGFMEIGESSAAGAARETQEEANAAVHILCPYAHWDIPVIGQVGVQHIASGC
jgi:ADP-ribose pyrophosphatase YjhB (NUDIX family)